MLKILLAVGDTTTSLQTARQIRPWLRERQTALTLFAVMAPGTLSPLSPVKRTLEQTEAIFTGPEEQPGIIVRVSDDPAAELCHQIAQGGYGLLAMGLRGQHRNNGVIGGTCRAVLDTCRSPMFITPPTLHTGMTPQAMFVVDELPLPPSTLQWLIAQCQAQGLNAILFTASPGDAAPLAEAISAAGIRTQLVHRSRLTASEVRDLGLDRRVRWIAIPVRTKEDGIASPSWLETLLSTASCPIVLVPSQ